MTIGTNRCRDNSQLLGRGAVGEHMATCHEGEFSGSKQSVNDDKFVCRPSPGCCRSSFGMNSGAARCDQHDVALSSSDQCGCSENCGNPQRAGPPGAWPETELKGDLRAIGTNDTVNLVRGDAGVGECAQGAKQRDRRRVVFRKLARLHRVVDSDDSDVVKRM